MLEPRCTRSSACFQGSFSSKLSDNPFTDETKPEGGREGGYTRVVGYLYLQAVGQWTFWMAMPNENLPIVS